MKTKIVCALLIFLFTSYLVLPSSMAAATEKEEENTLYTWSSSAKSASSPSPSASPSASAKPSTNPSTTAKATASPTASPKPSASPSADTKVAAPSAETTEETAAQVAEGNPLNLESPSAVLIEQTTGQILYSHNAHEKLRPASVTKIMSILLIMEQIEKGSLKYDDQIPCSENASAMGGSQIWLDTSETLSVHDMLKAICVVSANDCVVAMAEHIAGSEEAFVQMMNDKAKELGMNDTTFKNCHGIDEDGHVSSSYDIALMSKELLNKYPEITKYTTIWMDSLRDGKSELVNTNKLVKSYNGATGLKTGSTSLALYNLSASATRNGLSLIAVIMKAPSTKVRFAEAQKLLDYGFSTYSFKEFGQKDEVVTNVSINKGTISDVDLKFENKVGVLLKKGEDKNIEQEMTLNENISAPITEGQKLGEICYKLDGETLTTVNLVATKTIDKINLFSMSKKICYHWIDLLRG